MIRMRTRAGLLAYFTLAAAASTVLLVVGTRYRMPMVPALAIAAGLGVVGILDAAIARRVNELVIFTVITLSAIGLSHALSDPRDRNLAEEWAFTGASLITERDLPEAERAYRRALALDPESGLAWDGLGLAQYNAGRLGEARESFRRAIARDPDSARSVYHLAMVDARERLAPAAIAGYRKALTLSPYDVEIARDLGIALLNDGKPAAAIPFSAWLWHAAGRRASRSSDRSASRAGREARAEMTRVVELAPSNGEAWLISVCRPERYRRRNDGVAEGAGLRRGWRAADVCCRRAGAREALRLVPLEARQALSG
jgi:cytochrome c-type biogenesis protein CcmH/NrfG